MLPLNDAVRLSLVLWATALLAATGPAGCDPAPTLEQCDSGQDEDQDGLVGCDDEDCWVAGGVCPEVCTTIFDEDGDGLDGCEDSDCWVAGGSCTEVCDEDGDEDGDGLDGCADDDCWLAGGECAELCDGGGNDEDGDGVSDCADSACWVMGGTCVEVCDEAGHDEDGDDAVDCADPDCADAPACIPSYAQDVQPIFLEHCYGNNGGCHSDLQALGGLSFDGYDSLPLPSLYCGPMQTKAECSLFRILEPSMPEDCLGCVPQAHIDIIQAWVDAGIPR